MGWEEEVAGSLWLHQEWLELSLVNKMCKERHLHSSWLLQKESSNPNTLNFCPTPLLEGSAFSHFMRIMRIFPIFFYFFFFWSYQFLGLAFLAHQAISTLRKRVSLDGEAETCRQKGCCQRHPTRSPLREPTESMCCCLTPFKINHFREHKKQWIF